MEAKIPKKRKRFIVGEEGAFYATVTGGEGDKMKMTNKEFQNKCIELVKDYTNEHLDKSDNKTITNDDVYIVWCCKTLQNHKALLSTTLPDGMYYEITFNGDKNELYFDAYKKFENRCIKL